MSKLVLIKTEGNHSLGLGHIYRTIALSSEMTKKDCIVYFATTSEKYVVDLIESFGYKVFSFTIINEVEQLLTTYDFDSIVIDHMDIDIQFLQNIKSKTRAKIIIFGNTSKATDYSDVVVNAVIGCKAKNQRVQRNGALFLEGVKYLVLRDEFVSNAGKYTHASSIKSILLMFGGTDQANFSYQVLKKLIEKNCIYQITLVLGAGYQNEGMLRNFIQDVDDGQRVTIIKNSKNVAQLMLNSNFIITSPGTSLFEAFFLQIPTLAFYQNSSQHEVFGDFYMCEEFSDDYPLCERIESINSNYSTYLKELKKLDIGIGRNEIISSIIE